MWPTGLPLGPCDPLSPGEPGGPCQNRQEESIKKIWPWHFCSNIKTMSTLGTAWIATVTQLTGGLSCCVDLLLRWSYAGCGCPLMPSSVNCGGWTLAMFFLVNPAGKERKKDTHHRSRAASDTSHLQGNHQTHQFHPATFLDLKLSVKQV